MPFFDLDPNRELAAFVLVLTSAGRLAGSRRDDAVVACCRRRVELRAHHHGVVVPARLVPALDAVYVTLEDCRIKGRPALAKLPPQVERDALAVEGRDPALPVRARPKCDGDAVPLLGRHTGPERLVVELLHTAETNPVDAVRILWDRLAPTR